MRGKDLVKGSLPFGRIIRQLKKPMKKTKIGRRADTGRFVPVKWAQTHNKIAIVETIKKVKKA